MLPWLSLILCYAGFTGLALAMPRHHEELCGRKPGPYARLSWRLTGAALLVLSLVPAFLWWRNTPIAISAWLGIATVAAFALAMVLTWSAPRRRVFMLLLPVGIVICLGSLRSWQML